MPANLGTEDRMGMDFNYNWNANKWLRLFGNFNVFRYKNDSEFQGIRTVQEGNTFQSRLTAAVKLDKNTSFQVQGNYNAGQKTFLNERLPMYFANFGFSKTVLNNQGTINFNIQDIFNTQRRIVKTFGDNFYREIEMQFRPRMITLSFTYRFKNKFAEDKKLNPKRSKRIWRRRWRNDVEK